MLVGISHYDNIGYADKQHDILDDMAYRAKTYNNIYYGDWDSVKIVRDKISEIDKRHTIEGIVLLDEKIPTATVFRSGHYPDYGQTDNIYGNLSRSFIDKNVNGLFEVEDMPEKYDQAAYVGRLVPYCVGYSGVGWLKYIMNQIGAIVRGRDWPRNYEYLLDKWIKKLSRWTASPLESFVATSDWSGVGNPDSDNPKGFHLNIDMLRESKVFDKISGTWHMEFSDPERKEGIQYMWHNKDLGTAWHAAHSAGTAIGDFRYDEIYSGLKEAAGPTLLLMLACSIGEWEINECYSAVPNVYNSKACNNIKTIIASGIMQWGGSFQATLDPEGNWIGGDNFFHKMKKYEGSSIGLAHREWLNDAYIHYKNKPDYDEHKRMELLLQFLCMNITGDPTLIL